MNLTNEERLIKLSECETSKDFHSLYELNFGEEAPETITRDPNESLEAIIDAIYNNKKIKGVDLPKDINI